MTDESERRIIREIRECYFLLQGVLLLVSGLLVGLGLALFDEVPRAFGLTASVGIMLFGWWSFRLAWRTGQRDVELDESSR